MAEGINPIRIYGTGGENSGSQGGSSTPPNRNLQDASNAFSDAGKDVANNMDLLTQRLEKAERMSKSMAKVFKDNSDSLKHMVEFADDMNDALKNWQSWTQKLANSPGLFRSKERREVISFLEDFHATSKRLMTDRNFFNPEQQKIISRALSQTVSLVDDLKNTSDEAFDEHKVDEVTRAIVKMNAQVSKASKNISEIPIHKLTQGFRDINKIVQGTHFEKLKIPQIAGFVDKIQEARQMALTAKNTTRNRQAMGAANYAKIRADLRGKLAQRGVSLERAGEKFKFPVQQKVGPSRSFQDIATSLNRAAEGGKSGWLDKRLTAYTLKKVASAQQEGGQVGGIPAFLLRRLEQGGGSVTGGITGGSGFLGGAGNMVSELAGKAAVPLALLQAAMAVYDKNTEYNRAVQKGVGQGGLLTGMRPGETAGTRMAGFRNAINVNPLNTLGMTYEKNLQMMQDIVGSGLTIGGIARNKGGAFGGGGFAQTTGTERANDFFTTISRNAYIGGANIGMNPQESVRMTIKLLTTYRQSFAQSEQFFQKLATQTQAAGLSTGKYLEIIEGITSRYDNMNKSLKDVTDTLAILGKTGVSSADDLKDSLDLLTNAGQKRTTAQTAYLYKNELEVPGLAQQRLGGLREQTRSTAEEIARELSKTPGFEKTTPQELIGMRGNFADLYERMNRSGMEANDKQLIGTQLTALRQAQLKEAEQERFVTRGDFVGKAFSQQVTGETANDQMIQQMTALMKAMSLGNKGKGYGFGTLQDTQATADMLGDKVFEGVEGSFGTKLEGLQRMGELAQKYAATFATQAKAPGALPDNYVADIAKSIAQATGQKIKPGETAELTAANFRKLIETSEGSKKATEALASSQGFFIRTVSAPNNPLGQSMRADVTAAQNLQVAQQAAVQTRPTAEIFADAFTYLFNLLATPLNKMVELLQMIAHVGDLTMSPQEARQKWAAETTVTGSYGEKVDKIAEVSKQYTSAIQEMTDSVDQMSEGPEKKAAQQRLDRLKTRYDTFQSVMGTAPDSAIGLQTREDLLYNVRGADQLNTPGIDAALKMSGDQRAQAVANMLMGAGATYAGENKLRISDTDWKKQWAQIEELKNNGVIQEVSHEKGQPAVITINNFNTEQLRTMYRGSMPVTDSGEKSNPIAPKQAPAAMAQ